MILQWGAALAHHTLDARQVVVTPDDRGPQINVVAWTCMVVMVLSVGTRLAIKYNAFRSFGWDDGLVAVAMVRSKFTEYSIKLMTTTLRPSSSRSLQYVKQSQFQYKLAMVGWGKDRHLSQTTKFELLKKPSMPETYCIS